MTEATAYIGQPLRRREDLRLTTGKGRYVDDIKVPGATHMAVLRSPHAHAIISHVDLAAASAAPGVRLALPGADLVGRIGPIVPNWIMPGTKVPQRPVIAVDRVRFVGECVALVVARTQAMAYDAVGLIDVDYETLPAVVDEEAAIQDGVPQLHENVPNNITTVYHVGGGDYGQAAREADHIIKLRLVNNRLIPTCMETRSVLAEPNADGTLTVYIPSQVPHMHRRWIAETVGIPEHLLRIIAPDIGGGFGAKMHLYPEELLCPFLARTLGVPVKWWESRSESHQSTSHGRAHTENIEIAVRNDGRILGLKVETLGNVGAYLSNMASGGPTVNTINYGTGTYKIENYEAISRVVVTNTVPVDAYRGYGRPEGAYIAERAIDAVARHLNLDQVEVRRKNFVEQADFPYKPYNGSAVIHDSGNYAGCLDRALEAFNYTARCGERDEFRAKRRFRGIGVAAYTHMCGMSPSRRLSRIGFDRGGWESSRVSIDASGRAIIYSGSMSQGHGHATSLAQIAADILQIPIEDIDIVQGDTRQVQAGHGTFNSRSMAVGGSSVYTCSTRIIAKAKKIAASLLEVNEQDISYGAGTFSLPGTDIQPLTFAKTARMAYLGHKLPDGMEPGLDETVFYDPTGMGSPSGVHMAYVEVDSETGIVDILDYVAVDDAGRVINPLLAARQIHGGVVQGIGQALREGVNYDPDTGQLMTGSLLDYAVPLAEDVPNIRSFFQETPSPTNPIGVKGIGENGSIAAPPTIVHAVLDALSPFGITHLDMPMTPPRIWSAIQNRAIRSRSMIPASFDYVRATSLSQAIGLMQNDPDGTKLVAGGHSLIPTLKLRLASPARLVDICGIEELQGIEIGDRIRIGALTTHAELLASDALRQVLPIIHQTGDMIADPQVRNRGTIGGSLANADPAADWPAVVVALNAELELAGPNGRRRVGAREFFLGIMTTALETGDVLVAVHVGRPRPGVQFRYRKIRHPASGYAVVGVAVAIGQKNGLVSEASIGITGASDHAFAADAATAFLSGKPLSIENIEQTALLASEHAVCLSDQYASADYRKHLVKTEVARALSSLSAA